MMIIISSFHPAFCCVNTSQKVQCPTLYKYHNDLVIKLLHRQNRLFSFQNEHILYFLSNI